jgi:hypothetical protein
LKTHVLIRFNPAGQIELTVSMTDKTGQEQLRDDSGGEDSYKFSLTGTAVLPMMPLAHNINSSLELSSSQSPCSRSFSRLLKTERTPLYAGL